LKRTLEQSYDFKISGAFKSVDDWNYGYLDKQNLKRFLRQTGYLASKLELISIIRRFDTDGDAKINLEEFQEGVRSGFLACQSTGSAVKTKKGGEAEGHVSLV